MSYYKYPKVLDPPEIGGATMEGPSKRALQILNFFIFKARPIKFLR